MRLIGCLLLTRFHRYTRPWPRSQTADSYIVVDANAGKVINALNPDDQLHPASMTKIMTLFMTFEGAAAGPPQP